MTAFFFWQLRTRRNYRALWDSTLSYRRPLHITLDSERMRSSSASCQRLSMSSGSNGLHWGAISQQAGWVFSHGALSSPPPTLVLLLPQSSWRAHDIVACPPLLLHPSFCFRCSYISWRHWRERICLPPLDESTAIRWKARASHPSKLYIRTCWTHLNGSWTSGFGSAFYGCASGLPGQDACQWGSRSGCSFTQGPVTDLALHATKATAQAIGHSLSNLVVLGHHLWLTMVEM